MLRGKSPFAFCSRLQRPKRHTCKRNEPHSFSAWVVPQPGRDHLLQAWPSCFDNAAMHGIWQHVCMQVEFIFWHYQVSADRCTSWLARVRLSLQFSRLRAFASRAFTSSALGTSAACSIVTDSMCGRCEAQTILHSRWNCKHKDAQLVNAASKHRRTLQLLRQVSGPGLCMSPGLQLTALHRSAWLPCELPAIIIV